MKEQIEEFQPELLSPPPPICRTLLEASNSPKHAYYEISVYYYVGAGYVIQKRSGARGARPNTESWFRPNLRAAMEKRAQLVNSKTNKGKRKPARGGRVYFEIVVNE